MDKAEIVFEKIAKTTTVYDEGKYMTVDRDKFKKKITKALIYKPLVGSVLGSAIGTAVSKKNRVGGAVLGSLFGGVAGQIVGLKTASAEKTAISAGKVGRKVWPALIKAKLYRAGARLPIDKAVTQRMLDRSTKLEDKAMSVINRFNR